MGKLVIAGGRDFNDYVLLCQEVTNLCTEYEETPETLVIISGRARGADQLGEQLAKNNNIPVSYFPAEWDKYGKSAGYRRNVDMANAADAVIAFWDGKSKGTKHMIDIATQKGLILKVVRY